MCTRCAAGHHVEHVADIDCSTGLPALFILHCVMLNIVAYVREQLEAAKSSWHRFQLTSDALSNVLDKVIDSDERELQLVDGLTQVLWVPEAERGAVYRRLSSSSSSRSFNSFDSQSDDGQPVQPVRGGGAGGGALCCSRYRLGLGELRLPAPTSPHHRSTRHPRNLRDAVADDEPADPPSRPT